LYQGFNYHGWQKQPGVSTVQGALEGAIKNAFVDINEIQTMAASRTDSMVSALQNYVLLILDKKIDESQFINLINHDLPRDIKIKVVEEVDSSFRIIGAFKRKIYHYTFSYKSMPADFDHTSMVFFEEDLDLEKIKAGIEYFIGTHSFHNFCHKDRMDKFTKTIYRMKLVESDKRGIYRFEIEGDSFMRHQIRLMIGSLLKVGMGQMGLDDLKSALDINNQEREVFLTPALGLTLVKLIP
jgi:tRNA pseudouridine38-40 synthase